MPTTVEPSSTEPGMAVVTFRLPRTAGTETAALVGEFNGWSSTATPMTRGSEGFTATVTLAYGAAYRFKYLLDDERWENDWAADAYVPNEHGGDDSLVDLTHPPAGR
jgi:1,4-alpha-glucan branching enzyme